MGQLDEAIRAHLELKRKHGASEEELKVKEQEALGPVRREPPVPLASEPEEPTEFLSDRAGDADPEDAELYDDEPIYEEALEEASPEAFHEPLDPLVDPGFAPDDEMAADLDEDAGLSEEELEGVQSVGPVEPMQPTPGPEDTPRRGFPPVEEELPEEGEDVLEETPEFLQETPEHDRLWFEQKPPRDFDFDE